MLHELSLCKYFLNKANSQPIHCLDKEVTIVNPTMQLYLMKDWAPSLKDKETITMVSNSSNQCSFVYMADTFSIVREFPFNTSEAEASSTLRELASIQKLFTEDSEFLHTARGKVVIWITDSSSLYCIMRKGLRVQDLQDHIIRIVKLMIEWGTCSLET